MIEYKNNPAADLAPPVPPLMARMNEVGLRYGKTLALDAVSLDGPAGRMVGPALLSAGECIRTVLTHAPGNGASIGGLKVIAESEWFAARLSARKTSTRSMWIASRERIICASCWRKRR